MVFSCRIPVDSHISKKNNRPIHGRGEKKWIGKSERLRSAETFMHLALKSEKNRHRILKPLTGDIHATFRFFLKDYFTLKNERNRAMPDLSNLLELPQDCLQSSGVILNDCDIVCLDGSGRFPGEENVLEIELRILHSKLYDRRQRFNVCPRCHWPTNP